MHATITLDDGTTITGTFTPDNPAAFKDSSPGPLAPATNGGTMTQPRVGYRYEGGDAPTFFGLQVQAGVVYTFEAVPIGEGYGSGSVTVQRPADSPAPQAIVNGFCSAFPVQAQADEAWTIAVKSTKPGEIRYLVP